MLALRISLDSHSVKTLLSRRNFMNWIQTSRYLKPDKFFIFLQYAVITRHLCTEHPSLYVEWYEKLFGKSWERIAEKIHIYICFFPFLYSSLLRMNSFCRFYDKSEITLTQNNTLHLRIQTAMWCHLQFWEPVRRRRKYK